MNYHIIGWYTRQALYRMAVYIMVKTNDLIIVNIEAQHSTCSIYSKNIYVGYSTVVIYPIIWY